MKFIFTIIAICYLLPGSAFSDAVETVKIGAVFSKTGNAAKAQKLPLRAIRFAVEELNHQGGLLGSQIQLLEFDNKSTSIGSKFAAREAVKAGVVAVIGAQYSSHSLASAPVLQAAKIPMISPTSTHPDVTLVGNFIFRVCFIDTFQGTVMANFAVRDIKAKTSAVLINSSRKYSIGLGEVFTRRFREQDGIVLLKEDYLDKTSDYSFLLKKVKAAKPDVVFLPGKTMDSGLIIKQARGMEISSTFLGADGWSSLLYEYAGSLLHGSYY